MLLVDTPIEVLPARDEHGRVVADAYGLTGLRGKVTEEQRPGHDRVQVELEKEDGSTLVWSLPDYRVRVIRKAAR